MLNPPSFKKTRVPGYLKEIWMSSRSRRQPKKGAKMFRIAYFVAFLAAVVAFVPAGRMSMSNSLYMNFKSEVNE